MYRHKLDVSLRVRYELQDALILHLFKPGESFRIADELQDAVNLHLFKPGESFRIADELQDALLNLDWLNL